LKSFEMDYGLLDFRHVFGVPFAYLQKYVAENSPRLRLLSPYREHFAQAFARFMMRVGLPEGIPPFK